MKKIMTAILLTFIVSLSATFSQQPIVAHAYTEISVNTKGYVTNISKLYARPTPSLGAPRLNAIPRDGSMRVRSTFYLFIPHALSQAHENAVGQSIRLTSRSASGLPRERSIAPHGHVGLLRFRPY